MATSKLDLALKHQKYDEIWQGAPVLLMVVHFYKQQLGTCSSISLNQNIVVIVHTFLT